MNGLWALMLWSRGFLIGRVCLATENLALRRQLSVLRRQSRRSRLDDRDRRFWVLLKMCWPRWREVLQIVTPKTVVRWHRHGFCYYWRWKSRPKGGRKRIVENYLDYYQNCRTYLSLERNAPNAREALSHGAGPVISIPRVGGLHYEYRRAV